MLLYSPVAGAVARLALLVTVSPSTLSSFTWFLFSSFSSFFLLSVRSLLTWGAPPPPPLVTCWPLSPWSGEKGPGGPRSLSILCHVWGGRGKISSLREKRLRVRDAEPRWWRSALNTHSLSRLWWPAPICVSLGELCTKQRKSKDCLEDKIFNLKVNQSLWAIEMGGHRTWHLVAWVYFHFPHSHPFSPLSFQSLWSTQIINQDYQLVRNLA